MIFTRASYIFNHNLSGCIPDIGGIMHVANGAPGVKLC
jgi:hypothetical protein